jgi:trk system potassium uptake protein TrkA
MSKQAIVIGLGQFGMALARSLSDRSVEVLAIDTREERVRQAAGFAAEAACFDATDSDALARTNPDRRDVSICAIGDDSRESSIICTALLRQMGAPRIVGRANGTLHARILQLVGAHEVVNPERDFGERFALRLAHEGVLGELALGEGLVITELSPPAAFVGRTLAELQLPRRHGMTVVAIRRGERGAVALPDPGHSLSEEDVLVVVSDRKAVPRMMERS